MVLKTLLAFIFSGAFLCAAMGIAEAGIFNTTHFVEPGKMALGVEPEITLSDGAGVAGNLKYTQGVTDFMDAAAIIGTGTGPRRFRLGGDLVFDFFPDVDHQPGMGVMTRAIYYSLPNSGEMDLLGAPYIHKAFVMDSSKDEIDPFFSIPLGMGFDSAGSASWCWDRCSRPWGWTSSCIPPRWGST